MGKKNEKGRNERTIYEEVISEADVRGMKKTRKASKRE